MGKKQLFHREVVFDKTDKWIDKNQTECLFCGESFFRAGWGRDATKMFCQFSGKFEGVAHQSCKRAQNINPGKLEIPIVFHNLSGYDAHFVMEGLAQKTSEEEIPEKIEVIAKSSEKYTTIKHGNLKFIDSLNFLGRALESLVKTTQKKDLPKTAKLDEGKGLLFRKGVFPYEYIDSWRKYEDQNLPPKEAFYDALHKKEIKDSEHECVGGVWMQNPWRLQRFVSENRRCSSCRYLRKLRKLCIKIYGLDPLNYPTAPSFAWDALLQKTKVELELLTDIDMHLMIEKGMRGGVTVATKRFAKANNKYLKDYDPTKPSTYIMYYDANNLYGCAMVDMLPKDGFRWMQELPTEEEIMRKTANHPKGWILKVDLLYPKELHDELNDFPLAPEIRRVMEEEYSDWQKNCMAKLGQKPTKSKKLMMDFLPKRDYVVHYKNLQYYIAHGMKLIRVKSAIEFNQEKWMKDYIKMNTEKRQKAKNEFEKDFFKLMNNAVFGKTMENKRNRMDLQIFNKNTQKNKIVKQVASPFFEKQIMFPNGFVGIVKRQSEVFLNNDNPR